MGCGIESTSWKYGMFNEICISAKGRWVQGFRVWGLEEFLKSPQGVYKVFRCRPWRCRKGVVHVASNRMMEFASLGVRLCLSVASRHSHVQRKRPARHTVRGYG